MATDSGIRRTRDAAERRGILERAQALNGLAALLRNEAAIWTQYVVQQCMDPRLQLDLNRDDFNVRLKAMDALFVARVQLTSGYRDWLLAGLESLTNNSVRKPLPLGDLTLADAEVVLALWTFATEQQGKHQTLLAALSRDIQSIALGMARTLDPHTFEPLNFCEGFRLQVRKLELPAAGQILLGQIFCTALEPRLGTLYLSAHQLLSKTSFSIEENRSDTPEQDRYSVSEQPVYRTLEQVIPLLHEIDRNPGYSATSRRLLLSLKPTLLLLAASEGQAFANPDHPAKQLLTKLITGWRGVLDTEDSRHKAFAAIVNRLNSSAGTGVEQLAEEIRQITL